MRRENNWRIRNDARSRRINFNLRIILISYKVFSPRARELCTLYIYICIYIYILGPRVCVCVCVCVVCVAYVCMDSIYYNKTESGRCRMQ